MNKVAAGYIRVSTTGQKEKDTPEVQRDQIKKYAALHGLTVYKVYEDTLSGKKDERPGLDALFADAAQGKFQRVVFTKLDRFGRSLRYILDCYDKLGKLGIGVVSISENIDTSTPVGVLLRNILGTLAEFEASRIAERMYDGRYRKTALKESLPGREPFGFNWDGGNIVLNEDEAPTLRLIFSLYLDSRMSIRHLTEKVNVAGIRTRSGKPWQSSSITRILKNTCYTGQMVFFAQHKTPVVVAAPLVITPAQHAKVLEMMKDKSMRLLHPTHVLKDDPFLLRGLLTCGKCGSRILSIYDGFNRRPVYCCHWSKRKQWKDMAFRAQKCDLPSIGADKLHKQLRTRFTFLLTWPSKVLAQIKTDAVDTKKLEGERKVLQTRLTKAKEGLKRLYDLYADGQSNKQELLTSLAARRAVVSRLEAQLAELNKKLAVVQAKAADLAKFKSNYDLVLEGKERYLKVLNGLNNGQWKEFLRTVIDGRLALSANGALQGELDFGKAVTYLMNIARTTP